MQLTTEYQLLKEVFVDNIIDPQGNIIPVYLRNYAKYNSQDLTNNKTNVSVQLRIYTAVGSWYQQTDGNWAVGLSDNELISGQANQQFNQGETILGTITGWVNHNADGTMINCSCLGSIYFGSWIPPLQGNVDTIVSLPTIDRQSELVEKPVFTMSTDGNTQTFKVNIKKNNSSFYDVLRIKSSTGQITIKEVAGVTAGEHTYTFDSTERNKVFQAYGTETTERLYAEVETYTSQGGTSLGFGTNSRKYANAVTLNYTISTTTTMAETVTSLNAYKPNGHANDTFIANLSKPQFTLSTTSSTGSFYGQTVTYKLNNNIITSPYTENSYTGQSFTFNATDGRKNTSVTPSFTKIAYFKPTLTTTVKRTSPTGSTASVNVSGNLYDGTGLTNLGTPTLTFKYTESGGSEQEITIPLTINGSNFTGSATISNLNYQKSLTWSSILTDRIGVTTNNGNTLPQGLPVYHCYRDSNNNNYMNINGNLLINNQNVSDYLLGELYTMHKTLQMSVENTWYDTGIIGNDLPTGAYIVRVYIDTNAGTSMYWESAVGLMWWYSSATNSPNTNEIPLHQSGHANNGKNISLRTKRNNNGNLSLQMACTGSWSSAVTVHFYFRKVM